MYLWEQTPSLVLLLCTLPWSQERIAEAENENQMSKQMGHLKTITSTILKHTVSGESQITRFYK